MTLGIGTLVDHGAEVMQDVVGKVVHGLTVKAGAGPEAGQGKDAGIEGGVVKVKIGQIVQKEIIEG